MYSEHETFSDRDYIPSIIIIINIIWLLLLSAWYGFEVSFKPTLFD